MVNNDDLEPQDSTEESSSTDESNTELASETQEAEEGSLESIKQELEKAKNDYLYLRADFDNYRKRSIEERSQYVKYAGERVFRELLGILDNFDLALQTQLTPENLASFEQGIRMIRQEISSSLERNGVIEIDVMGKKFDPAHHEALSAEETSEVPEGHVCRVFKKAYKLHDRMLRPAQVVVAKAVTNKDN